jgi:hypothetical protein
MTSRKLTPAVEDEQTMRTRARIGPLIDLVDRALAHETNECSRDATTTRAALREVRAFLIEQRLRASPANEPVASFDDAEPPVLPSVRKHRGRSFALGGALLVVSVVWAGRMRGPQIPQSVQAVLVSAVQPGPVYELTAADDTVEVTPNVAHGAPMHGTHRRLRKVTARTVGEVAALSTSPATADDLTVASLPLALRTAPTPPPPVLLSDLLDRRK